MYAFFVTVDKRLGNSQEPLYGNDHHPKHGHGDGDVLNWVSDVWNYSVVPICIAHINMVNEDIVKEVHEDQEGVNQSKDCQIRLENTEEGSTSPAAHNS